MQPLHPREMIDQCGKFSIVWNDRPAHVLGKCQEYLSLSFENPEDTDVAFEETKADYPDSKLWEYQRQ